MKKSLLTLILCAVAMGISYAQFTDNMVLQPTHVVAKRINAQGEVTKEMPADFSYDVSGKLSGFSFPEFCINSDYFYNGDYLMQVSTRHSAGHPIFYDVFNYTYENGKVKTKNHLWDAMNANEYWQYEYDESGRLKLIKQGDNDVFYYHFLYEYENDDRTVTMKFMANSGTLLRQIAVSQYDDAFNLISVHTENYNWIGEQTTTALTTYTYTENGQLETQVVQTLTDGEWINTSIIRYAYDDEDRIIERLDGTWDETNGDWDISRRIDFDYSEDGLQYTVSFYKKSGNEWVWDMFNYQTVLFDANLKLQQTALEYMIYEVMNEPGRINQLVFTLTETNEPPYVGTEEHEGLACCVYPNPGNGDVRVEAPTENTIVRFYDLQGKLMKAKMFDFNTSIEAENWPSGIYLWEIWHDNQKEACGKWIKE